MSTASSSTTATTNADFTLPRKSNKVVVLLLLVCLLLTLNNLKVYWWQNTHHYAIVDLLGSVGGQDNVDKSLSRVEDDVDKSSLVESSSLQQQHRYECTTTSSNQHQHFINQNVLHHRGEFYCIKDGSRRFGLTIDGRLVYVVDSKVVWTTPPPSNNNITKGGRTTGDSWVFQSDGNLVLRNSDKEALWSSDRGRHNKVPGSVLVMGKDGLMIKRLDGGGGDQHSIIWKIPYDDDWVTPRIAWLMSFPNSGTTYTLDMVKITSQRAVATNYGQELISSSDNDDEENVEYSISIHGQHPEGPYWSGLSSSSDEDNFPLPDKYVMTKTHCLRTFVEVPSNEFLDQCTVSVARIPPKPDWQEVTYEASRVAKAIHLIRNPFHNIISRYHHDKGKKHHEGIWLKDHDEDKRGFDEWCKMGDERDKNEFLQSDHTYFINNDDGQVVVPKAPCRGEFYKYIHWHNSVPKALTLIPHDVPTLTVHYEDYTNAFNTTVDRILDFLELDRAGDPASYQFSARSDYGDYYTEEEQAEIKTLLQKVASNHTWNLIQHYFN